MPWPDFSELSFGFSFLREFERQCAPNGLFPSAPDFISQNKEAALGYDVEVALAGSAPIFFQFKRSFVLTTRKAREIQKGQFTDPYLYRMHLHAKDNYRQHRALRKLEKDGNAVFYVTSQIPDSESLTGAYLAKNVVRDTAALFSPREIRLPTLGQDHHLTFRAQDSFAYVYSSEGRRFERHYPSWERVRLLLDSRRRTINQNRSELEQIASRLAQDEPAAAQVAQRFEHPAIRASVLAFLTLDSYLTFYGEQTEARRMG